MQHLQILKDDLLSCACCSVTRSGIAEGLKKVNVKTPPLTRESGDPNQQESSYEYDWVTVTHKTPLLPPVTSQVWLSHAINWVMAASNQ